MKPLARDCRGVTLIESIIAIALLALVTAPVLSVWFVSFYYPPRLQQKALAAHDIEQAQYWLKQDMEAGPAGNNLGTISKVFLAIGTSPGLSGNNALSITYRTWPSASSTSPTSSTVGYALEALDSSAGAYQLVRTSPSGAKRVIAAYIADPAHVVFSGSSASSTPGATSQGITVAMTSTVGVASQSATLYVEPRVYQPLPTPTAASSQTWIAEVPTYLYTKSGFYTVITTEGSGAIQAAWSLTTSASISVSIFLGTPMGTTVGDSLTDPSKVTATLVASNSATTTSLTVTSAPVAAQTYTVYFFNGDVQNYAITPRGSATVTYVSSTVP